MNYLQTQDSKIAVIDSRDVATMTGIRHDNLKSKIDGYVKVLENQQKSNDLKIKVVDFFVESTYEDAKGETRPCYLLTRKGCDMVANKMTGEKGIIFTAKYVTKFEDMEKELAFGKFQLPTTYKEALLQLVAAEEEKEQLLIDISTMNDVIAEQNPKVELYEDFISTDLLYSVGDIAKTLAIPKMGRNNLYKYLRWNKIFMDGFEAYQNHVKSGHVIHRTRSFNYETKDGLKKGKDICGYFTPKGVEYLYKKLKRDGHVSPKSLTKVKEELQPTTELD